MQELQKTTSSSIVKTTLLQEHNKKYILLPEVYIKKGKAIPVQTVEALRVARD
jgi:hypothetical protein